MGFRFVLPVLVIAVCLCCNASNACQLPADEDGISHEEGTIQPPPPRRPPIGWRAEWITDSRSGLVTSDVDATVPLLGPLGTPPPLIKAGFGYTELFAAEAFELPDDLFEYSIGMTWIRPVNDRWTVLALLGATMATDNENRSSDAWQFRGGVLGIYEKSECWKWTVGAIATGRDDLPVIPAVGVIWQPRPDWRIDLNFPRPSLNVLIADTGSRQQWVFAGGGINGKTWAYERNATVDDRLTYRDLRIVAGWESRPSAAAGMPVAFGKTMRAEIGYVFAREFEFLDDTRVQELGDSWMTGITTRY